MKKIPLFTVFAAFAVAVLVYSRGVNFPIAWMSSLLSKNLPQVRPLAEFEPTFGVAISEQILFRNSGIELIKSVIQAKSRVYIFVTNDLKGQVDELFSMKKPFSTTELSSITRIPLEHESPWLRDYLAIPLYKKYPHLPLTPSYVDFVYRDGSSYDDAATHQFALAINSSVEHVPLVLDGGNFMTNGLDCVVSEEITDDPDVQIKSSTPSDIRKYVHEIFAQILGCQSTLVVNQQAHPHVDMVIKFVNKTTVLVNSISAQSMSHIGDTSLEDQARIPKIKNALDRIAEQLEKRFRVIRLPMPLPVNDIFFTYANSVIVNDTVLIPRYENPDPSRGEYPDRADYGSYEEAVRNIYQSVGLKPVFLNSDDLIKDGGALHCITFHLPDLESLLSDSIEASSK